MLETTGPDGIHMILEKSGLTDHLKQKGIEVVLVHKPAEAADAPAAPLGIVKAVAVEAALLKIDLKPYRQSLQRVLESAKNEKMTLDDLMASLGSFG